METPTNPAHHNEDSTLTMMNTPQFLNYVSTNTSCTEDMLSSPIASKFHSSQQHYESSATSNNNTTTITTNNNKSTTMMNMALTTLLLLSPSKQNKSSLLHTPTKYNHDNEMMFSSPLSTMMMDTPRGTSNAVRRTLDFDESMDNFEEVSLSDSNQVPSVIKNTHSHEFEKMETNFYSNFGDSMFASYFQRIMSLLLAVLLFPTNMMKKDIQSTVIPVERNVNIHNDNHHLLENKFDHYICKIDDQQKRINELETIIKKMSYQIEDLLNSKIELEKRVGNVEEKQKEIPQPESVESKVENPQTETLEENTEPSTEISFSDLDSNPKTPIIIEPNSAFLFIVLPIVVTIFSIL